jgi:hypothetical protein
MLVPPVGYPVCKKCNEGNLLPFYSSDGRNVYFCTNCKIRFTAYVDEPLIDKKQIFLETAQYISSDEILENNTDNGILVEEPDKSEPEANMDEADLTVEAEHTNGNIETEPPVSLEVSELEEIEQGSAMVESEPIALGPKTELSEPMELERDDEGEPEPGNEYENELEHKPETMLEDEQKPDVEPEAEVDLNSDEHADVDENVETKVEDEIEQPTEEENEVEQINEVEDEPRVETETENEPENEPLDTSEDREFEEPEESIETSEINTPVDEDVTPTLEGFPTEEPEVQPEQETEMNMGMVVESGTEPEKIELAALATPDIPYAQSVSEKELKVEGEISELETEPEQMNSETEVESSNIETSEIGLELERQEDTNLDGDLKGEEHDQLEQQVEPIEPIEAIEAIEAIEPVESEESIESRESQEDSEPLQEPEEDERGDIEENHEHSEQPEQYEQYEQHEEHEDEDIERPEGKSEDQVVDNSGEVTKTFPETINLDNSQKGDTRLQNLLKEFELPVIKNQEANQIEIQTPEDKADNIEVYKKLVQKYKSQDNGENESPGKEEEQLE